MFNPRLVRGEKRQMSYSIAGIKKKLKKEKGRKTDYAFDSGVGAGAGVCPPSASFIAKPSMPLT
jgi:hypothetical protein